VEAGRIDVERGRRLAFYSLLFLAQALDESGSGSVLPVLIVTTDMQSVLGHEVPDPARALVLGPALVMPQDVPFLRARVVDLASADWSASSAAVLVTAFLCEAAGNLTQNRVAYRAGFRWVAEMSPLRLEPPESHVTPFRERGVYLITGGLSGIGLAIATHLAGTAQARLVLVTRSGLPTREQWSALVDEADADGSAGPSKDLRERIRGVMALEALGAEVLVAAADVADEAAMRGVLEAARVRFGNLHGVVHAAGLPGVGLLPLKAREAAETVLRPKVEGTLVIDRLLAGADLDFLVLCSSINSAFGWQGTTDYSAANAFQDAFVQAGVARCTKRSIAINWGPWAQTGMAARNAAATGTAGTDAFTRSAIGTTEGVDALRRALLSRQRQVFVSPRPMPELLAEVETLTRRWQNDYRGSSAPVTAADVADSDLSTAHHARPELSSEFSAATTPNERTLCGIWEELLGVRPVGVHDNFFELGGHSLLATRVLAHVQGSFHIRLTLRDVFDAATVKQLVNRIEAAAAPATTGSSGAAEEEREELEF
jgi:NAD(P)-dependent dehydrogenase (short-subunit alcohol dehydrogenase family)